MAAEMGANTNVRSRSPVVKLQMGQYVQHNSVKIRWSVTKGFGPNKIILNINHLKVPGPIASDFFKLSEILVSEESSYFSDYPW